MKGIRGVIRSKLLHPFCFFAALIEDRTSSTSTQMLPSLPVDRRISFGSFFTLVVFSLLTIDTCPKIVILVCFEQREENALRKDYSLLTAAV